MVSIIIDDETAAIGYLESLIKEFIPEVEVVATANNALEGVKCLKEHKVDILFCDIEMPGGSGFDLINAINPEDYKIVFTTAYADFALRAFKINADGYLLKPIDIDDLEDLIQKFVRERQLAPKHSSRVVFKTHESIEYVDPKDIIRVEGDGNYSTVYVADGSKIIVSKNMKQVEELLPHPYFLKTHKSYLVNKNHIARYVKQDGGHFEMSDKSIVPVSRRKKEELLKMLEEKSR